MGGPRGTRLLPAPPPPSLPPPSLRGLHLWRTSTSTTPPRRSRTSPRTSSPTKKLWQRILIPVIVIVVLLLIIAFILCCVYRRKRKATVQMEEDKAYLSHKKPVIFLEEFEEKPHFVSLQPLIFPNEKPPTPGQHYEPRADSPPVGAGSSTTVSTASEEKPLTPASPDNSRK